MPYIEAGDSWSDYIDKGLDYGQKAVSTGQKVVTTAQQGKALVQDTLGIFSGSSSAPPAIPAPVVRDTRGALRLAMPSAMAPRASAPSFLGGLFTTRNLMLAGAAYLGYRFFLRRK